MASAHPTLHFLLLISLALSPRSFHGCSLLFPGLAEPARPLAHEPHVGAVGGVVAVSVVPPGGAVAVVVGAGLGVGGRLGGIKGVREASLSKPVDCQGVCLFRKSYVLTSASSDS